jgi:hypothetical protein
VNAQLLVLAEPSVAVQVPVVTPLLNVEPEGGVHVTDTPGQLSVALAVKVTLLLLHWPGSVSAVMLAGQVIDGAWLSRTGTVNSGIGLLEAEVNPVLGQTVGAVNSNAEGRDSDSPTRRPAAQAFPGQRTSLPARASRPTLPWL